jgi:hypothetical protein
MKRVFLVMVVSAMLVTLGFAQTPDASSDSDLAAVKGCLGGSEGNYTVVQDGTGQLFQITSSSIDLKAHLGHDVKVTGHKAAGAANSLSASEVSMISEHCAAAAAAIPAAVTPSPETVVTPDPAAAAPATASAPAPDAAAPPAVAQAAATVSAPVVDPAAPAATVNPAPTPAPITTPPVEAAAPPTTVSQSAATVTSHVVEEAAPAPRPLAHAHKLAKQATAENTADAASATTASPSPEPVTPAAKGAATPVAAATPSPETVGPPDATTVAPAPVATHRTGSLALLVSFVVLIIVLGTTAPLVGRWRKRKMLERDGAPNLSFTNEVGLNDVIANEAKSNEVNTVLDKQGPRKIA